MSSQTRQISILGGEFVLSRLHGKPEPCTGNFGSSHVSIMYFDFFVDTPSNIKSHQPGPAVWSLYYNLATLIELSLLSSLGIL